MNNAPILILQMQRMGDLVLSFPLLGWLERQFQGHPIWVVGEKSFFEPLLPLSPHVTYFSYEGTPNIAGLTFHAVINLSHRAEAAALAGKAKTDTLIGPYLDAEGRLLIRGDWQLYRASLTHNNRYNRFHWADLNALDIVPSSLMLRTNWPLPRALPGLAAPGPQGSGTASAAVEAAGASAGGRIGLFLGASEPEKHPDVPFWIALTRQLLKAGHKPVLLGGPAEAGLGLAVARGLNAHPLNLCGHFTVGALAHFISELDLFITPDTGPMHIATWTGTPTLNISLGPVNPWETGPFSPGHHIVRAALGCTGCWRCTQKTVECKDQMVAGRVAAVAETLLGSRQGDLASLGRVARGLELLRTARGSYGLYRLDQIFAEAPLTQESGGQAYAGESGAGKADGGEFFESPAARQDVALFWQAWFGALFGRFTQEQSTVAWKNLSDRHPAAARQIREGRDTLALILARALKKDASLVLGNADAWEAAPPLLRPLSGYIQMYVQNSLGSRASFAHALELIERVVE